MDYLDMSNMAPTSGYAGSQTGSDYGFDTPSSIPNGNGAPSDASYRLALDGLSNSVQDLVAFKGMVPSPPVQGLSDGTSPIAGHHHSLSVSSNDPFGGMARHNSFMGSDTTSPTGRTHAAGENSADGGDVTQQITGEAGRLEEETGVPPAWSELKTKAGKERKRLPLACIACRRKKIRCSGEKPACKHCLRSRIPCVYKVTTRKAAPRTDYMAMLDKRLKRMEDRVIKVIPKDEQSVISSTDRAVVKPPLPPAPPKAGNAKKRAAAEAFSDELEAWSSGRKEAIAKLPDAPELAEKNPLAPKGSEEQNLLLEGADKLPTKDIQEHLAEVFFDYVYGQSYHLLHKPSFMRKLAQGTVPPVLTLAVCAISARFSNHPAVRTEPAFLRGETWARAARDIALKRYDTPNITILICYLILGLHEFGTCQGGRSWMFGGMAQRMAYALQLHKDLDHDPKERTQDKHELTFTDREIRRRTMWSCFLMDRFSSSGSDRPIFVGEQYIRAQLPIKESFYQLEINGPTEDLEGNVPNPIQSGIGEMADPKENMGVAAYMVRLVSIWGKLIAYLNMGGKERDAHPMWAEESRFQGLKRATAEWKEGLPLSLHYSTDNLQYHASEKIANQFIFLHLVYHQILLFMNRFALPVPGTRPVLPKDMPEDFMADAAKTALEAANQISALINEAGDHLVVAPFAGYIAFFSSTVHIHGAFSKNAALEASSKQNLAWNVKYLTKMKKYWGMFHFVTENLRDLYRRRADAARSGGKSGKEGEQTIFQYGDWFDRYPHGVSGTDYEEPSTEIKKEPGSDAVLGQRSDLQTVEEFFSKLSPPSRTKAQQQQPARKTAKKRNSTSAGSKTAQPVTSQPQQPDQKSSQVAQQQPQQQPINHDLAATAAFQSNMDDFMQPSTAFSPGFQSSHNPLIMTSPQQFMSQLDRQIVLNCYANSNENMPNVNGSILDNAGNNFDNFDWNAFANSSNNSQSNNDGFWGDPSTAWFMPFNMDPPTVSDDNHLFTGKFDWSNTFADFGDMVGMPPTGLTPRPTGDVEIVQVVGMDGMDHMQ